ncbi:MAG: HAD family phosphatase [Clostridia bacterium]|nr:HAD family phosphatase [Clostridia bacterium]
MDIKIIASDLDGTLLAPDHVSITPRTLSALTKAHSVGVKIAISTGRTLSLIKDVAEKLPFVDFIIYSNGAGVYDCNKKQPVFVQPIKKETSGKIIDMLDRLGVYYNVYAAGNIWLTPASDTSIFEKVDLPKDFLHQFLATAKNVPDIKNATADADTEMIISYFAPDEARNEIMSFVKNSGELHTVSSFSDNIEIISEKASKGNAVKAICDILGCTAENTMTFGDAWNDCSMLEFAEHSFAMENGDEKSKNSAKNICPSNAEDGVAQMIEKFILNAQENGFRRNAATVFDSSISEHA